MVRTTRFPMHRAAGLMLLAGIPLWANNIPVTVQPNITPTQAVIQYTATAGNCTIAVTDQSGLSVTVWDVSGSTFTNANIDISRPDTVQNGMQRTVILGHRTVQQGVDGKFYSRALQAATQHTVVVTCGSDSGTATFTTQNIPLGGTYPELPMFDNQNLWNYAYPTIDYTIAGKEKVYIDPLTGAAVKRVTGPGESNARVETSRAFVASKDLSGGGWSNVSNAIQYGNTNYASSSTTNAKMLIAWGNINMYGSTFGGFGTNSNGDSIDDLLLRFHAYSSDGSTAVSACITIDGQTCYTGVVSRTPSTTAADVTFPQNGFPNVPWQSWSGKIPPRHLLTSANITATINGQSATITAPDYPNGGSFNTEWAAGMPILVPGSSAACVNNICTIASVNSTVSLSLVENSGGIGPQLTTPLGGGVLVWKSFGSGTIFVNANYDLAHSSMLYLDGADGQAESCSRVSGTTSVNPDDSPVSGDPLKGFLCKFGNGTVYFFDTDHGSTRYLSNNFFSYIGSGSQARGAGNYGLTFQPFDLTDSRTWYTYTGVGDTTTSLVFYKSRYTGDFSSNSLGYQQNAEPSNVSQSLYTALAPNDIGAKFRALIAQYPLYKTSIWAGNAPGTFVGFHPSGYALFGSNAGQDTAAWIFPFYMPSQQFTGALDSFSHTGTRWGSWHTVKPTGDQGYGWLSASPLRANCGNCSVQGPYQMPISQVWRSTDGVNGNWDNNTCVADQTNSGACVSATYAYACPASTSAYWNGAGQNNCIRVRTSGEPCNANPTAAEIGAFPCPWNSSQSMLQTAEVGDLTMDATTQPGCRDCEQMRIVQKTINSSTDIEWWLYRQAFPYPYPFNQHGAGKFAHTNGWKPRMANEGFDNLLWWANFANPTQWYPDAWQLQTGGHYDSAAASPNNTFSFTVAGGSPQSYESRRITNLPGDIGTLNNLGLAAALPVFDNSSAGTDGGGELETYVSGKQVRAPDSEKIWVTDWRTPQNGSGTIGETPQQIWPNTVTGPVAGTTLVYTITNPFTVDIKRQPLFAYAGRWRLQDISGPSSVIGDSNLWTFCYAYFAGECRPDSSAGAIYVNVPQQEVKGCLGNQMSIQSPCVFTAQSLLGYGTQTDVSQASASSTRFRRLTGLFQPPGRSSHFEHLRVSPDGRWGFYNVNWAGGYRNEIFAVRIPPFPNGNGADSVPRITWTKVTVPVSAFAGLRVRVKFGYDPQFHCSSRNEACYTDASGKQPFLYASEINQASQATACNAGCSIDIPAISGRLLYYTIERIQVPPAASFAVSVPTRTEITLVP